MRPGSNGSERSRDRLRSARDQFRLSSSRELAPSLHPHRPWERRPAGEEAAAVVVRIEQPHGDARRVAGFDGAGARVVVVEAPDFDLPFALVSPFVIWRRSTSGRPTSQKLWFEARFFFRSSVSRSAFICAVRKVMPVFSLVMPSMSLAASGSNSKAAKTRIAGLRAQGARLFPRQLDLALFQQAVLGAERDNDPLRAFSLGFGVGVQPARAGQRFDAREVNMMSAFAPKSGFEQFVAPFGMAESRAGAGDGGVGSMWRGMRPRKSASECLLARGRQWREVCLHRMSSSDLPWVQERLPL